MIVDNPAPSIRAGCQASQESNGQARRSPGRHRRVAERGQYGGERRPRSHNERLDQVQGDCGAANFCALRICVLGCSSAADCDGGQICDLHGRCAAHEEDPLPRQLAGVPMLAERLTVLAPGETQARTLLRNEGASGGAIVWSLGLEAFPESGRFHGAVSFTAGSFGLASSDLTVDLDFRHDGTIAGRVDNDVSLLWPQPLEISGTWTPTGDFTIELCDRLPAEGWRHSPIARELGRVLILTGTRTAAGLEGTATETLTGLRAAPIQLAGAFVLHREGPLEGLVLFAGNPPPQDRFVPGLTGRTGISIASSASRAGRSSARPRRAAPTIVGSRADPRAATIAARPSTMPICGNKAVRQRRRTGIAPPRGA